MFETRTVMMILSAALWVAPAYAESETVEVEGVAAVVNDDIALARDRALDDAKRKAVEQVAGAQVSAQSISENFELVEDKIYSRASGFVRNYEIASEAREEGVYKVKIRATVDKKAVADDLAQLFIEKPRVIVMLAEQNVGAKGFSYWWGSSGYVADLNLTQNTLIERWQPKGFKFVDPALLTDQLRVQGAMQKPELSNDQAVTIGRDADADIVIVGKVLVSDAGQVMEGVKMHSFHAVGTLRVLNVDTGEIVAVADDTGVAPHVDPNLGGRAAIKVLAGKLADVLQAKIMAKWTQEAMSAKDIEVVAKGVKGSRMLRELTRTIREQVRGVESVRVRRRRGQRAFLTIRLRGRAPDLGRDIESKTYKGFEVAVTDVSRAKVTLQLSKR